MKSPTLVGTKMPSKSKKQRLRYEELLELGVNKSEAREASDNFIEFKKVLEKALDVKGHVANDEGVGPNQINIKAIFQFERQRDMLRRFLQQGIKFDQAVTMAEKAGESHEPFDKMTGRKFIREQLDCINASTDEIEVKSPFAKKRFIKLIRRGVNVDKARAICRNPVESNKVLFALRGIILKPETRNRVAGTKRVKTSQKITKTPQPRNKTTTDPNTTQTYKYKNIRSRVAVAQKSIPPRRSDHKSETATRPSHSSQKDKYKYERGRDQVKQDDILTRRTETRNETTTRRSSERKDDNVIFSRRDNNYAPTFRREEGFVEEDYGGTSRRVDHSAVFFREGITDAKSFSFKIDDYDRPSISESIANAESFSFQRKEDYGHGRRSITEGNYDRSFAREGGNPPFCETDYGNVQISRKGNDYSHPSRIEVNRANINERGQERTENSRTLHRNETTTQQSYGREDEYVNFSRRGDNYAPIFRREGDYVESSIRKNDYESNFGRERDYVRTSTGVDNSAGSFREGIVDVLLSYLSREDDYDRPSIREEDYGRRFVRERNYARSSAREGDSLTFFKEDYGSVQLSRRHNDNAHSSRLNLNQRGQERIGNVRTIPRNHQNLRSDKGVNKNRNSPRY